MAQKAPTMTSKDCASLSTKESGEAHRDTTYFPDGEATAATDGENILMKAISKRSWHAAVDRARRCPDEAYRSELVTVGGGAPARLLPVQYACTLRPPCPALRALVDAAPDALMFVDQTGRNLLHWAVDSEACADGTAPETVKSILSLCPGSARQRCDKYGCLPLHVACFRGSRGRRRLRSGRGKNSNRRLTAHYEQVRAVQLLIDAYPGGVRVRDRHRGFLPLHIAVRTGAPAEIIQALLEKYPSAAEEADRDERLPIHYATRYHDLWDREERRNVFGSLVEAFPEGLKQKEKKSGLTPLGIACSLPRPPRDVISILLSYCPRAASVPDIQSSLPLHTAARANADCGVIDALLCANKGGAREWDGEGMLPLHWSCTTDASARVVENLIRAYPAGTSAKNRHDSLPLHLAVKNAAEEGVIVSLLRHHPEGAWEKDGGGALPIHLACGNSSRVTPRLLRSLLVAYPEGLHVRDCRGRTPADYVRMSDGDDRRKSDFLEVLASSLYC